ncbi:MAG: hypothetical protein ACTSVB_02545 [Candidatus Heimdallarchaeaceae archaeon]
MFTQIAADIDKIRWEYKDKILFIEITGFLRSAGYTLIEPKVKISEHEKKISISLLSRRKNTIATQALVPFTKKIEFSIPSKGTWQVICNDKEEIINI